MSIRPVQMGGVPPSTQTRDVRRFTEPQVSTQMGGVPEPTQRRQMGVVPESHQMGGFTEQTQPTQMG